MRLETHIYIVPLSPFPHSNSKLASENVNKETKAPILMAIAVTSLTGVWIGCVCFSFILPMTDTTANWKGFWCIQETRNMWLLVSIILHTEFLSTVLGRSCALVCNRGNCGHSSCKDPFSPVMAFSCLGREFTCWWLEQG